MLIPFDQIVVIMLTDPFIIIVERFAEIPFGHQE